jgi:hypothetical protein
MDTHDDLQETKLQSSYVVQSSSMGKNSGLKGTQRSFLQSSYACQDNLPAVRSSIGSKIPSNLLPYVANDVQSMILQLLGLHLLLNQCT